MGNGPRLTHREDTISDPRRRGLNGSSDDNDRLWIIHTPKFSGAITEYNDELTGFDPKLRELDKVFVYGGNAYYIINKLAPRNGWRVEKVEDRR